MNYIRKSILCILVVFLHKTQGEDIICPLVWYDTSLGEPIPSDVIATASYGQDNFVARIQDPTRKYKSGRAEEGIAYYVYNDQVENSTTYQLLTNPHGCLLEWTQNVKDEFAVPVDDSKNELLGRAVFNSRLQSGHVSSGILLVATDNLDVGKTSQFEILRSYSKGLKLEVSNFKFESSPFAGNPDFIGIDQLYNRADTVIRQVVRHRKDVFESTEITTKSSWGHTFYITLEIEAQLSADLTPPWGGNSSNQNVDLPIPPLHFEFSINYPAEKFKAHSNQNSREIAAEREVIVEPHTSVMICSTVTVQENSRIPYVAIGKYSGAGMNATDVQKILDKDGLKPIRVEGNNVYVEMAGTFSATSAMATRFYVTSFGDGPSCSEFSQKISHLKRDIALKRLDAIAIKQRQRDIQNYMQNMTAVTNC